jgi:hypothetical protein
MSKPTVVVQSVQVFHFGSAPKQYGLTLEIEQSGMIGAFNLQVSLTEEEAAPIDNVLEKLIERIKSRLRESF